MYKLYVGPHLDYGDITYRKVDPELSLDFTQKLEATQYSAALAMSGAWRGTNKCKLYKGLGWENLYHRRQLTHFFKLRPGRIKKRAAHSENFLGGLVCTRNLAFRLQ